MSHPRIGIRLFGRPSACTTALRKARKKPQTAADSSLRSEFLQTFSDVSAVKSDAKRKKTNARLSGSKKIRTFVFMK
ncbi:hypothetical protein [Alistipes shahii]